MAYVISDDCISCGTCAGECPVGAISEGDGKFEINADECLDCGSCAAACPTGAISRNNHQRSKKPCSSHCRLFYCIKTALSCQKNRFFVLGFA